MLNYSLPRLMFNQLGIAFRWGGGAKRNKIKRFDYPQGAQSAWKLVLYQSAWVLEKEYLDCSGGRTSKACQVLRSCSSG